MSNQGRGRQPPTLDLNYQHLITKGFWVLEKDEEGSGGALHPLITEKRDTGVAHYVLARHYGQDDMELVAMCLGSDDCLTRGGGATRKNQEREAMDDLTLAKSCQRSRRNMRIACRSAQFDRMITLTQRDNVTDYDESLAAFKRFCRLMKKVFKERWVYVAVPEKQKRGSYHFHIACKGYFPVGTVRRLWLRALGNENGKGEDSPGNIDITSPKRIGKNSWNPRRIAQYLAKYIAKDTGGSVEFNRKRYFRGGTISLPEKLIGWCPACDFLEILLDEVIYNFTRRSPDQSFQMDGYYQVIYKST